MNLLVNEVVYLNGWKQDFVAMDSLRKYPNLERLAELRMIEGKLELLRDVMDSLIPMKGGYWFKCLTNAQYESEKDVAKYLVQGQYEKIFSLNL